MSVTSSFPCLKIPSSCSSSSSSSTSSSTTSYSFRFSCSSKPYAVNIRNSQTDGPLRRPVAPPVRESSSSSGVPHPLKPTPPSQPPQKAATTVVGDDKKNGIVTIEFQRQKAKELQEYFKQKKLEEADQGPLFGFIARNEISNGRWAMFGFAVGLLTEYATGSDFVDQVQVGGEGVFFRIRQIEKFSNEQRDNI